MTLLKEDYRYHVLGSSDGGVPQRWVLIDSEHCRPQARRTVQKRPWSALSTACRTPPYPMPRFHPTARDGTRGRPWPGASSQRVDDHIAGALASSWTAHHKLVMQQSCCLLATNELDHQALSPQEVLEGYKGQKHAERGFRFLKDPQFLASSLYRSIAKSPSVSWPC
jgi:transposase